MFDVCSVSKLKSQFTSSKFKDLFSVKHNTIPHSCQYVLWMTVQTLSLIEPFWIFYSQPTFNQIFLCCIWWSVFRFTKDRLKRNSKVAHYKKCFEFCMLKASSFIPLLSCRHVCDKYSLNPCFVCVGVVKKKPRIVTLTVQSAYQCCWKMFNLTIWLSLRVCACVCVQKKPYAA